MTSDPIFTISIVSHGDADKIGRLLASLQIHETDSKRFRIILTDNLHTDLPHFDPAPWDAIQIIRNKTPLGFAFNHNNAFKYVQSKWFAILNPDLIFESPIFNLLLKRLEAQPRAIVAPQIVDENGHVQDSFRPLPTPLELICRRLPGYTFRPYQPDLDGLIRPDWMAGMFWLMDTDIYRLLGGMDIRYRLYFEDVDFCTRARLAGIQVLCDPRISIRHDARRSSRRKLFYLLLHTQSAVRFFTSSVYRQARRKFREPAAST